MKRLTGDSSLHKTSLHKDTGLTVPYNPSGGGGGGDSNIKKVGVLVVSLRGVNFRFWSRLGCFRKNHQYF